MTYWTTPKRYPNGSSFSPAESLLYGCLSITIAAAVAYGFIWLLSHLP